MIIQCEYKTDKIPLAYQMMFVSLIKESLKKKNEEYYKKLYFYDGDKSNKKIKDFCFSVHLKEFEIKGDEFLINDKVVFSVSSPNYEFMIYLYDGLLQLSEFSYKNKYHINKVRIRLVKERKITKNKVVFKTMSPIFIKDKFNNSISPKDKSFNIELNYICNEILKSYRGYGLREILKFTEKAMKKQVVKEEIRNFQNNTNKRYFYVNCYSGIFELEGDINDLNDLYKLGVGFKRSQGFGMLDVVG